MCRKSYNTKDFICILQNLQLQPRLPQPVATPLPGSLELCPIQLSNFKSHLNKFLGTSRNDFAIGHIILRYFMDWKKSWQLTQPIPVENVAKRELILMDKKIMMEYRLHRAARLCSWFYWLELNTLWKHKVSNCNIGLVGQHSLLDMLTCLLPSVTLWQTHYTERTYSTRL